MVKVLLLIVLGLHQIDIVAHLLMRLLLLVVDDPSRHEDKGQDDFNGHVDIVRPLGYLFHHQAELVEQLLMLDVNEKPNVPKHH